MTHTYSTADLSNVDWYIPMVYDPGESRGFLYTVGLEKHGRSELFIRDVPRMRAEKVAQALNLIGARETQPVFTERKFVAANGLVLKGETHSGKKARALQKEFLCQAKRNVSILELSPAIETPPEMETFFGRDKGALWADEAVFNAATEMLDEHFGAPATAK